MQLIVIESEGIFPPIHSVTHTLNQQTTEELNQKTISITILSSIFNLEN